MPTRLAQHLVARGLLPSTSVEEAQRRRATYGGTLDTVLLEMGVIAEPGMLQALGDVSGVRPVNLADFEPNPDMARFIPANVAERLGAVPLSLEEESTLHVACIYPPAQRELDEVAVLLGKRLEPWVAVEARVRDWISSVYGTGLQPRFAFLLQQLDPTRAPAPIPLTSPPKAKGKQPEKVIAVDEATLEDALTREMVEQIARAVAEEPILLEVRKKPSEPRRARAADEEREVTRKVDLSKLAQSEAEETRPYDLTKLAAQSAPASTPPPGPAPTPATWEREQTVTLTPEITKALARDSVAAAEASKPARAEPPPVLAPPTVAPLVAPPPQRTGTQPDLSAVVVFPNPDTPIQPPVAANVERVAPAIAASSPAAANGAAPEWSLADAREALKTATQDRDQIIQVALAFARRTFEFAAAFAVVKGSAAGWAAEGQGADAFRSKPPTIPLDSASVFRTVAMTRGSYVGPVPGDTLTARYLAELGRAPRTIFLFPVEVKDRLVCILYGDPGSRPISQRRLADLLLLCQDLPAAFQQLIVFRKQRFGASQKQALSLEEVVPAPAAQAMGWSPAAPGAHASVGRVAAMPGTPIEEPERPPPDFTPVLRKLVGPDTWARSNAMAELARTPEASARVLAQNFPGPTAWSRLPVTELPDAEELGPIPAALSRLGRPAAQALAPLLDSDDADVRYFALLTGGNLVYPELVGGVLRGLFDYEPDISSAARAAASAFRRLPRFVDAMPDLRQELTAMDTLRRSLAARALGVMHDREAIEGLINLTGSDDALCAQAAAEALYEITRASFGPDQRRWTVWWAENRGRTRGEWLVAALRHPELEVRLAAIEELSKVMNDNYGYFADATPADRDAAARKWDAAIARSPRLKKLE